MLVSKRDEKMKMSSIKRLVDIHKRVVALSALNGKLTSSLVGNISFLHSFET